AAAQRELVRIGIDRPAASATGGPERWAGGEQPATFPRASFEELAAVRHHRPVVVLDVRRALEWDASHIDGAVHIPLQDLPRRLDEVPGGEVWVHCGAGYRAAIAASFLAAAGRRVVAIDDAYDASARAGLPVVATAA
ncbi:rhodanese-like domain-containing protein, partial [Actinomadura welshii]